jgi:hypothetical protein
VGLAKRQRELKGMQDRLLNAYLAESIEEATYQAEVRELRHEEAKIGESVTHLGDHDPVAAQAALAVFDRSQNVAEIWDGSKIAADARSCRRYL